MKIVILLLLVLVPTLAQFQLSDIRSFLFGAKFYTISWQRTIVSNNTLHPETQALLQLFDTDNGTYTFADVQEDQPYFVFIVSDGKLSNYSKMLEMKVKYDPIDFDDVKDGRQQIHYQHDTYIQIKIKQQDYRNAIKTEEIKPQLSYFTKYIKFKELNISSEQLQLRLTIETITLADYESKYRWTGYLHFFAFFTFTFVAMMGVDSVEKLKCEAEVHYTFIIFLAIWSKIYIVDTSFAKDGIINFIFIFEVLTVLMAAMYIGITLMFIQGSSLNKYVKIVHCCLLVMLCVSVEPIFLLIFTIFHIISLQLEVRQKKQKPVRNFQALMTFVVVVLIHILKFHLDSVPKPPTIQYDWQQKFRSYNIYEISNQSLIIIYINAFLSIVWYHVEKKVQYIIQFLTRWRANAQKRRDQLQQDVEAPKDVQVQGEARSTGSEQIFDK